MEGFPLNIMFEIWSRMPVKSLAHSRCVSKEWCEYIVDGYLGVIHGERVQEEPTPVMFLRKALTGKVSFHIIESKKGTNTYQPNKELDFEFVCTKPLFKSHRVQPRGSCNGLLLIAQDNGKVITTFSVIHPLRKECYELPAFPLSIPFHLFRESCGLGFDASTNTLKMVCVLLKNPANPKNPDLVRKNLCTMVHVFGTNSWREIQKIPSYPIQGEAISAHGCLYWLVSYLDRTTDDVISFDVRKEEFVLINPPIRSGVRYADDHLVDLKGEVGLVCNNNVTMEVWVLKQKEWVLHCKFVQKLHYSSCFKKVLGFWNKDGDILIKGIIGGVDRFFVYNLNRGDVIEIDILVGREGCCETGFKMFPNSLFSLHGINTNSNSIHKTKQ